MDAAVRDGLLITSPCAASGRGRRSVLPRFLEPVPAVITREQARAIVAATPEQYGALVEVLAWCGLRLGEALALRRRSVDLNAGLLTISEALTDANGVLSFRRRRITSAERWRSTTACDTSSASIWSATCRHRRTLCCSPAGPVSRCAPRACIDTSGSRRWLALGSRGHTAFPPALCRLAARGRWHTDPGRRGVAGPLAHAGNAEGLRPLTGRARVPGRYGH